MTYLLGHMHFKKQTVLMLHYYYHIRDEEITGKVRTDP